MNKRKAAGFVLGLILYLGACATARVSYAVMTTGLDEKGRNVDEVRIYIDQQKEPADLVAFRVKE